MLNANFRDKTEKLIRLLAYYWSISDGAGYVQPGTLFGEVLLHRCGKSGGKAVPRGFRPHDTERLIGFVGAGMRGVSHHATAAAD